MALAVLLLILGFLPLYPGGADASNWAAPGLIGVLSLFLVARVVSGQNQLSDYLAELKWPLILFCAVLAWIAVQGMPYSPDSWHHPLWQMEAEASGGPYEGRISVDPLATYMGGLKLLAYGLVVFVVSLAAKPEIAARRTMAVLTGIIVFYSTVGLATWLLGGDSFLWPNNSFADTHLSGRQQVAMWFENPGHLAVYASMGLIICLGMILEQIGSFMIGMSSTANKLKRSLRHLVVDKPCLVFALLLLGAVLLLIQSPTGYMALGAGLFTLMIGAMRANILPIKPRMLAMACLACAVLVAGFAAQDGLGLSPRGSDFRSTETGTIVSAIQASPWLGYGYGSYDTVSQMYAENGASYMVERVHSAILETTLGMGIPGVLVLFATMALLFRIVWRGTRYGRGDRLPPVVASAVSVQMVIHVSLENALQMPTLALCFMLIVGLGISQSILTEKR